MMLRGDEEFVRQARARLATPLSRRDRWTSVALGGTFLTTAVAMAALLPGHRSLSIGVATLLVGCYAAVSRVEFELGPGSAVPTQLVLVPMLFLVPVSAVPLCVAAGYVLGLLIDYAQGKRHGQRAFVLLSCSWHSVGPAVVLALFGHDEPRWDDWPIYAAALAAQFLFDLASSTAREKLAFGVSPRELLPFLVWVYAVDALLAPIAFLIAAASTRMPYAALLALPLVALLALLARDRTRRIDRALELSEAYRGATRQARSDPLTGVGNRLAWDEAIEAAKAGGAEVPVSVIVVDVDGLKLANDTGGHELGDRLLRSLADVVRTSVRADDLVARIGGDEFGVLMLDTGDDRCGEVAGRISDAIARHAGLDSFRLSAAVGHATRPAAAAVAEAARIADMQMYLQKHARSPRLFDLDNLVALPTLDRQEGEADHGSLSAPARTRDETCDVLLTVTRERDQDLEQHLRDVAELAVAVAARLGVTPPQLDDLRRAAWLHDIGKLAVPDAILGKRARLTDREKKVMRRHPVVGARILASVHGLGPVARLVRASHERYDGQGYPDQLAADEIPLGARIIFVCDSYDAMTSDRPYRPRRTHEDALAQLRAGAAAQFDPLVVDAFCEVVAEKRQRLQPSALTAPANFVKVRWAS
jgi:diguanylate cyclase (GGDEF)-like protein/putative nucleotidyltransferase with HDIG domain